MGFSEYTDGLLGFPDLGGKPVHEKMEVFSLVVLCREEADEEAGHRGPEFAPNGGCYRAENCIVELVGGIPPAEGTHVLAIPLGEEGFKRVGVHPGKVVPGGAQTGVV